MDGVFFLFFIILLLFIAANVVQAFRKVQSFAISVALNYLSFALLG